MDTRAFLSEDQSRAAQVMAAGGMSVEKIAEVLMVPEDLITGTCPEWRVGRIERVRVEELEAGLITPERTYRGAARKRAFLAAFASNGGNKSAAAKAAGIERTLHYRWLRDDPKYKEAFEEAREHAADVLEDETVRRAKDGTLEPLFNRAGELIGHKLRFSDQLLLARLAADRPERWRSRVSAELTGADGRPIEVKPILPEWLQQALQANSAPPGSTSPSPAKDASTRT